MALPFLVTKPLHFLLLFFLIAHANLSTCTTTTTTTATVTPLLEGSVSCLDCSSLQDLSGVKVAVSCSHTSQVVSTLTNKKGEFEVKLPSSSSSPSAKCIATILGGKVQLCAFRKDMVSKLVKPQGSPSNSFILTTPLNFFTTSCPSRTVHAPSMHQKLDDHDKTSSPSTPDNIPQPYPWGLPPPCYFCHFLPIIGIP